jgi:hypothetical protein
VEGVLIMCTCGDRPEHVHHVRRPAPKVGAGRDYLIRSAHVLDSHTPTTWCGAEISDTDLANKSARFKSSRSIACPDCLTAYDTENGS